MPEYAMRSLAVAGAQTRRDAEPSPGKRTLVESMYPDAVQQRAAAQGSDTVAPDAMGMGRPGPGIAPPAIAPPRATIDTLFGRPHEIGDPAADAASADPHVTVFDDDESAPESRADNGAVAHITANETGTSPPGFPGSKELGMTQIPDASNLRDLRQPMFYVRAKDPASEGEQASAQLCSVRAPVDGTVNVYVVQPGQHSLGERNVQYQQAKVRKPLYLRVTDHNSALVRQGELEHVSDMTLAFDLTFGNAYQAQQSIKDNIYHGATKADAENQAWKAFIDAISPELYQYLYDKDRETMNAALLRAYLITLLRTKQRDNLKYHHLKITNKVYDPEKDAAFAELDESTAKIGTIPSATIIYL